MAAQRLVTVVSLTLVLSFALIGTVGGQFNSTMIKEADQLYALGLTNLTGVFVSELRDEVDDCIIDPVHDWNMAFNFTPHFEFIVACMATTGMGIMGECTTNMMGLTGNVSRRLCTAAEVKFYLATFVKAPKSPSYFRPNRNCNLTSWVNGCEPGWHCSASPTENIDIENSKDIPSRTSDCLPCCEGFFCPHGLTCMFPCPLGSHCSKATYDETTGLCQPYSYQLPPERPEHKCGGANMWSNVDTTREIFCPEGSYCPSSVVERPCHKGFYCRTGSTTESRCSKMITCEANAGKQNIHFYGIMLIAALVAVILLIYNCLDHLLIMREQRRAASREKAASIVRESKHARTRWKAAIKAAKKHADGLQASLSRRFSNRYHPEERRMLDAVDIAVQDSEIWTEESNEISMNGTQSETRRDGTAMSVIENKHVGQWEEAANGNSYGQVYGYACEQTEKDKSLERKNENLTFQQSFSVEAVAQPHKRPLIEVSFEDLTLTLRGNKQCLIKSFTGKIVPGHIAAMMGPSGAGKTTFISALAGKATGCKSSGLIHINGQLGSIQSYRKIVGFVPQDDILHGNLTVEENLWFSAQCRLSSDMKKADKLLILERVIENLGLEDVRSLLVGTIENRGISGGQRKRVNVGLELVMEPSLLFLDEPTSGLDSSSSRSLLRALRHEAHTGVNICMVVHQPRMFDELILLAKGGLLVYLGPVSLVEEYFKGFGFHIPEHVNPPDYYIDILEGLVEPSGNSGVSFRELPLRWMLHKGYSIPQDMQVAAGLTMAPSNDDNDSATEEQSLAGELWQDLRCRFQLTHHHLYDNFFKRRDLSNRRTPNIIVQYWHFLGRISKQRLREARLQATDYMILVITGACLGVISNISDATFGAFSYSYTIIAVSLLCEIASLRTFSLDKLQYLRERASGMSSLANFLAKDTVDHINTLIKPMMYLFMFYFFANPRTSFLDVYAVLVCLVYCVTGIGYASAIFLEPGPAQLFSVMSPVCLTLIATQALNNPSLRVFATLSYPSWALEALVVATAKRYHGVWLITRCAVLLKFGYSLRFWWYCILVLVMFGIVSRILAFICMVILLKK